MSITQTLPPRVARYRDHLQQLDYLEYAHNHAKRPTSSTPLSTQPVLNLSLWNDSPPPGVVAAGMRALPKVVGSYCLAQDESLRGLLAEQLGIESDMILITAGADDALRVATHYCVNSSTRVLIPVPSFGRYSYHALIREGKIFYLSFDTPPYELDIPQLIHEVQRQRIDCLYLASPNNPTGHALTRQELLTLLDTVTCSVLLDESLLLLSHAPSSAQLLERYPHVFICGSFSKLYGLAGMRIGYLLSHKQHHSRLGKLISPFGVDGLAIEIAKHMLGQRDWLQERIKTINAGIDELLSIVHPRLHVSHTSAPVALLTLKDWKESLHDWLATRGIHTVAASELPGLAYANAVRIIIRDANDMSHLKTVLAELA